MIVIRASGITAPIGSVTVPAMVPVGDWASTLIPIARRIDNKPFIVERVKHIRRSSSSQMRNVDCAGVAFIPSQSTGRRFLEHVTNAQPEDTRLDDLCDSAKLGNRDRSR